MSRLLDSLGRLILQVAGKVQLAVAGVTGGCCGCAPLPSCSCSNTTGGTVTLHRVDVTFAGIIPCAVIAAHGITSSDFDNTLTWLCADASRLFPVQALSEFDRGGYHWVISWHINGPGFSPDVGINSTNGGTGISTVLVYQSVSAIPCVLGTTSIANNRTAGGCGGTSSADGLGYDGTATVSVS